jgi:ATP-dependent Clp endopeptidase proteolytic subunit ClpP
MKLIEIENRAGKLRLNDGVHKDSADKLIEELDALYGPSAVGIMSINNVVCAADDALESVEVEINSPGGSVFEGQRIYNALRGISARGVEVTTTVNGLAASMGSVILMAGDKRRMNAGSRIMIHEASTIAMGDARAFRKTADLLEGISSEIAGIYADRTGGELKAIRNLMFAETWMTADEAKTNGFVDTVIKDGKAKAEFDTEGKGNMSILAKLFPGNDQVAQLEASLAEVETLSATLESAQAKIVELTGLSEANAAYLSDLVTAQAKANELEIKIGEFEAKVAEYDIKLAEATAAAEVTAEKVSIKAAELLATQGHPAPVNLIEESNLPEAKTLTREAFNALTPRARLGFVQGGGKIS